MATNKFKIVGIHIQRPGVATARTPAAEPQMPMELVVEVENTSSAPLHVWASYRSYDYDAGSRTLKINLAEEPLVLPPNIVMLSDHPRAPEQIEVGGKSQVKMRVRIPPFVRRAAPDGRGWIEDPIGPIDHVDVQLQHAPTPFDKPAAHESDRDYRVRLQAHGAVIRAHIRPASN